MGFVMGICNFVMSFPKNSFVMNNDKENISQRKGIFPAFFMKFPCPRFFRLSPPPDKRLLLASDPQEI